MRDNGRMSGTPCTVLLDRDVPDPCMSLQNDADLDVTVASRSARSFEAAQESHPALRGVAFTPCDIDDTARLAEVLQARAAIFLAHAIRTLVIVNLIHEQYRLVQLMVCTAELSPMLVDQTLRLSKPHLLLEVRTALPL